MNQPEGPILWIDSVDRVLRTVRVASDLGGYPGEWEPWSSFRFDFAEGLPDEPFPMHPCARRAQ